MNIQHVIAKLAFTRVFESLAIGNESLSCFRHGLHEVLLVGGRVGDDALLARVAELDTEERRTQVHRTHQRGEVSDSQRLVLQ